MYMRREISYARRNRTVVAVQTLFSGITTLYNRQSFRRDDASSKSAALKPNRFGRSERISQTRIIPITRVINNVMYVARTTVGDMKHEPTRFSTHGFVFVDEFRSRRGTGSQWCSPRLVPERVCYIFFESRG